MSCVINDVRAPSPVPEVAELSQICEGLARQRPDNIQTLLHAMALIAPLLIDCAAAQCYSECGLFYQRCAGPLFDGQYDPGTTLRV